MSIRYCYSAIFKFRYFCLNPLLKYLIFLQALSVLWEAQTIGWDKAIYTSGGDEVFINTCFNILCSVPFCSHNNLMFKLTKTSEDEIGNCPI